MAEKKVCVEHPSLPKMVCFNIETSTAKKEAVDEKQVEKAKDTEMDRCMRNEECRSMYVRLQLLTSAKTGFPGL